MRFTWPEQSDWCNNLPIRLYDYTPVLPVNMSRPYFSTRLQGACENLVSGDKTNLQHEIQRKRLGPNAFRWVFLFCAIWRLCNQVCAISRSYSPIHPCRILDKWYLPPYMAYCNLEEWVMPCIDGRFSAPRRSLMSTMKRYEEASNYHNISWSHPLPNLAPPKCAL